MEWLFRNTIAIFWRVLHVCFLDCFWEHFRSPIASWIFFSFRTNLSLWQKRPSVAQLLPLVDLSNNLLTFWVFLPLRYGKTPNIACLNCLAPIRIIPNIYALCCCQYFPFVFSNWTTVMNDFFKRFHGDLLFHKSNNCCMNSTISQHKILLYLPTF